MEKPKLIRITTVPLSLDKLLSGQLNYMNSFYEVIAISSEKEYLERVGEKEKVQTFHLEMSRKITPIQDFLAVIKLYRFLKVNKPLIVHTHTPKAGIVGMLASKLAGIPYRFHTVAGLPLLETKGFKRTLLDFVEKLTYSCATKVYPNSHGLSDIILKNNYCSNAKLKVIANGSSNGIDTAYFNPDLFSKIQNLELKAALSISTSDFVFVFVGRLVADKGINEMVAAFKLVNEKYPNAKLLLVGDYESDLDPLSPLTLDQIKANDAIITVGFQSDVRPYLAVAHALVFPSYREGFPNVVMQSGAMGLPSIVSNINGCNEIIVEGQNGTIIPVKNTHAIIEKMEKLIDDSAYYTSLKNNARRMIVERYEQKVVWSAIIEEYRSQKI
ncbi:glycosyltransferase family 4 protein [Flavobacterium sangjuense]|uniref:N, N'-diacetylbacillosaminyl-diphospho-undecaprenol alpha-1,3-N-acetylgalactosaminyltransferase n=1 Tax=Flavobacterium sangjuense TaxID=2518177 RepID=A0A4P7PSQ2_9FLAO|nr:glycosyltransferase family 4 protein [Flavobacterium sangjuense]QBZ97879.1 N,N'-diacetylbacillosaminyl-diphospho-undecaprenol alpha-1,3-N-acetylgalactosaminyltransferase [Flavobacterium sangjuense]